MKNHELIALFEGLHECSQVRGEFAYLVAHNLRLVSAEVEDLEAIRKPTEAVAACEMARVAICLKHAKKDDKGEAIVVDGTVEVIDQNAMAVDYAAFQTEHMEALADKSLMETTYNARMKEEAIDIKLLKHSRWEIPEEINAGTLGKLFPMIDHEAPKPVEPGVVED